MGNRRWTDEELTMLKNGYLTSKVADLAAQTNRSTASVYLKANELQLIKTQKRPVKTVEEKPAETVSEPQPAG